MKKDLFDKYYHYRQAVQSPDTDVVFFRDTYRKLNRRRSPKVLREDFCAAFALCCAWVKLGRGYRAIGVDVDREPLIYGANNYLPELTVPQQQRVITQQNDVLLTDAQADVICAVNFSYFYFKQRATMKQYLANCYRTLNAGGVLILDCFGGSACHEANEEETEYRQLRFSYYWDQEQPNPITNYCKFHIHFKRKGEAKRLKVFSYDWRIWSLAEMIDLLREVGFNKSTVYWEGTDEEGEGNGIFTPTTQGEECEAWVCYIVSQKK